MIRAAACGPACRTLRQHPPTPTPELGPVGIAEGSRIGVADRVRITHEQPDGVGSGVLDAVLDRADGWGHAGMAAVVVAVAGARTSGVVGEDQPASGPEGHTPMLSRGRCAGQATGRRRFVSRDRSAQRSRRCSTATSRKGVRLEDRRRPGPAGTDPGPTTPGRVGEYCAAASSSMSGATGRRAACRARMGNVVTARECRPSTLCAARHPPPRPSWRDRTGSAVQRMSRAARRSR